MVKINKLTKKYGEKSVIDNLNFILYKGAKLTVFAPSGSGKTTLINIINGLDKNFTGSVIVNTELIATVFQEPRLFGYMTVKENIFFPLKINKIKISDNILDIYSKWLSVCGLEGAENYYPYQLSGGMKIKTALIRGFLPEPEFILMDEPFRSIDIKNKMHIIDFIKNNYPGITVLFVTHSLDEIPLFSDRLILFRENKLQEYLEFIIDGNFDLHKIYKLITGD